MRNHQLNEDFVEKHTIRKVLTVDWLLGLP
jgi:hypothetical protein